MSSKQFTTTSSLHFGIELIQESTVVVNFTVCDLTEAINLEKLGDQLFSLVDQNGCRRLVVNLDSVRTITAAAVGKLIVLHRRMHRHQGRVVFCHLHPPVQDVLQASNLLTYLRIAPDLDGALVSLSQD